jgi:hypothetical protein
MDRMDISRVTERLHRHLYRWQLHKPMNNLHCCHDMLWDATLQALPGWLFKAYHNILCLSAWGGHADGCIQSVQLIARHLGIRPGKSEKIILELIRRKLLVALPGGGFAPSEWGERKSRSGNSTERMRRWRENRRTQRTNQNLHPDKITKPVTAQNQLELQGKSDMSNGIDELISELDEVKFRLPTISDKNDGWDFI